MLFFSAANLLAQFHNSALFHYGCHSGALCSDLSDHNCSEPVCGPTSVHWWRSVAVQEAGSSALHAILTVAEPHETTCCLPPLIFLRPPPSFDLRYARFLQIPRSH